MLIRYWSSDVCSSDLPLTPRQPGIGQDRGNCPPTTGVPTMNPTHTDNLKSNLGEASDHLKQAAGHASDAFRSAASVAGDEARLGSSEERRGGKGCVSTCRSRWWPQHYKKKKKQ